MQVELPSPAALQVYLSDLASLSDEQFAGALTKCRKEVNSYGRFPTIAMITAAAGIPNREEVAKAEALKAYEKLMRFVDKSAYRDPEGYYLTEDEPSEYLDARTLTVVRMMGGWGKFKNPPTDIEQFIRKDFMELYQQQPALEYVKSDLGELIGASLKQISEGKKMP